MKRHSFLLPNIADPENLRLAFWKASKGKRYAPSVLSYQKNLDQNLFVLRGQILCGEVNVGRYRFFKIFEPKERQICASAFGEQVLHHATMNICHEYFEHAQIDDSFASRKGKGVHAALDRAKRFQYLHTWYLKLDIRKFFETVHHLVLKEQLRQMFKDRALLHIFDQIIDSYQPIPERGLPIGNLTSQYFANHYLVGLDRLIKDKIRISAYVRYMDDMVLWHGKREVLKSAFSVIRDYVEPHLLCSLKPEALNKSTTGLPFLGYHIFPHHVRLTQQSKQRFIQKMMILDENYHTGIWSEAKCQRHALPLISFTHYADSKKLRKNVMRHLIGQSS